jgi:HEAT repeat protein
MASIELHPARRTVTRALAGRRLGVLLTGLLAVGSAAQAAPAQSLDEAKAALDSRETRDRRKAVQQLGKLATPDAYALIVSSALEDREPMVADEAQLVLGAGDGAALELLFGRKVLGHREPLVRLRAGQALGVIDAAAAADQWLEALKDPDQRAKRAFLESLELQVAAGRVTGDTAALAKVVQRIVRRGDDEPVRGAALVALARLAPALASEDVGTAVRGKSPLLRSAALAARLCGAPEERLAAATEALQDPHTQLRVGAVEALLEVGTKPAIEALVAHFGREARTVVLDRMVSGLRRVSGLKHGANARVWQAWADSLADDWRVAANVDGSAARPAQVDTPRTTSFIGHEVRSDRVTFVIDMSGSMWSAVGDTTRKARVERELEAALRGLPATARFGVAAYTEGAVRFERGLVDATPKNVDRAVEWFRRLTVRGKGDAWGALVQTLEEDPEADTLILLTDGAPSGGERWNVALMAQLLQRENRLRHVTLDVVLFEARKNLVKEWRGIAEASGGRATEVDL